MDQDGDIYTFYDDDVEPVIQSANDEPVRARPARARRLSYFEMEEEKLDIERDRVQERINEIRQSLGKVSSQEWRGARVSPASALDNKLRGMNSHTIIDDFANFSDDFDSNDHIEKDLGPSQFKIAYDKWKEKNIDPVKIKAKAALRAQADKTAKTLKDAGLKAYNVTMDWFLGDLRKKNES